MAHIYYRKQGADYFYAEGHTLLAAEDYDYIGEVEFQDLDTIFRAMNAVDGSEIEKYLKQFRCRSLSVGDVVDCDHGTFVCAGIGWKNLHDNPDTLEFGRAMETVKCLLCHKRVADDSGYCDDCDVKECSCERRPLIKKSDRSCRECHLDDMAGAADDERKRRMEDGF